MNFHGHALLFDQGAHFGADVGKAVDGGDREVAALHAVAVTEIAAFEVEPRRPGRLFGIDLVEALARGVLPANCVENEEFGFGAEIRGVADPGALQIGFGALCDRTRVAGIALPGRGLQHVAGKDDRVHFTEGVHARARGIGQKKHVGRFDAAPPRKGRAVKGLSEFKRILVDARGGNRKVHFLAGNVGETKFDVLDVVVLEHLQCVRSGRHDVFS